MTVLEKIKKTFAVLTESSKDWSNRKYSFYLLFIDTKENQYPWDNKVWNKLIEPLIDQIISKSDEYKDTGIRVLKYQKQTNSEYYKDLKLGRLRWDNKSHDKWTTKNERDIYFKQLELWTPIWTKCEKVGSPPDIFLKIENEKDFISDKSLEFDTFIVFAIATDLTINGRELIVDLSQKIGSKKTVYQIRKWSAGKNDKDNNWKFSNWIQDTYSNGIYHDKSLHNFSFKDIVFEPYWETIYENEK